MKYTGTMLFRKGAITLKNLQKQYYSGSMQNSTLTQNIFYCTLLDGLGLSW